MNTVENSSSSQNESLISRQVNAFNDYHIDSSAVVLAASSFVTNNPVNNLRDFDWNASDVHSFNLEYENAVEGHEAYPDQLAVESQDVLHQTVTTLNVDENHHYSDFDLSADAVPEEVDYTTIEPKESSSSLLDNDDETKEGEIITTQQHSNLRDKVVDVEHVQKEEDHEAFISHFNLDKHDEDVVTSQTTAPLQEEEQTSRRMYNQELYEVVTSQSDPSDNENEKIQNDLNENHGSKNNADSREDDADEKYSLLLENLHKKYEGAGFEDKNEILQRMHSAVSDGTHHKKDVKHPLVSLMKIDAHSMKLLVKPKKYDPNLLVCNNSV